MKPSLLVFNPNGDMDLILRQSRAQRIQKATHGSSSSDGTNEEPSGYTTATEDQVEHKQGSPVKFKNVSSSVQTVEDLRNLGSRNELGQHIELRYRVSSAHLALASPVFKAMVDKSRSFATVDLSSRSKSGFKRYAEALLILLDVIHGHHKSVPKAMSLELLIELWGLIDSHKCHEVVEMFVDHWVGSVIDKDKIEGSSLKTNMSRLYISWVFGKGEYFDLLAHNILKSTAGSIQTDLPLQAIILETLEHRREAIVNQVLDKIYVLLEELWSGDSTPQDTNGDPFPAEDEHCCALALGRLMKGMRSFGLEIPRPVSRPINEKSFMQLCDFTTRIELKHHSHGGICKVVKLRREMRDWYMEICRIDICDDVRFRDFEVAKSTQDGKEPSQKRIREASVIITNTRVCSEAQKEL
ncbi:hypothetical protein H9Q74_003378 [Fusarium xylarioides]|nr:hypothetical protein H9Q71_002641 [Fusarium xylarioides]KAG5826553.1 hypothetical protein H9Q74_003378 [Fusarium xylarioides]